MRTVIYNAKAYLKRDCFAQAVCIEGERISAAGSNAEMRALAGDAATSIDAEGRLLLPGFHDSHLHLQAFGRNVHLIDVHGVTSIDEMVAQARAALLRLHPEKGSIVHGSGWNQEEFAAGEKRYPNRFDLDRISTEHGVILLRICGHTISVNTKALEIIGLMGQNLPAELERDAAGTPLGVFHENTVECIRRIIPPLTDAETQAHLEYAFSYALSLGLTSLDSNDVFDDNYEQTVTAYRCALATGKPAPRIRMQCCARKPAVLETLIKRGLTTNANMGHPLLTMGPVKLFADGSLGGRSAALRAPYADAPAHSGFLLLKTAALADTVRYADRHGFQVIIHAIGDAAIAQVVACFEAVTTPHHNPLRHGVVHSEVMAADLFERMACRDILVFSQPVFLTHDIAFARARLGERARFVLPSATLLRSGIRTSYGTDSPVESMNPLEGIACAVRRVSPLAPDAPCFFPEERVDVYSAVDAYTAESAYAGFAEGAKGRIQAGYLADLTLLDRDIFTIAPEEIAHTHVCLTMVGGEVVYRK
ncbi:MAG: amidohydrolase [Treponema sp.]|jgi:predicted amidohydrolase YtcJ|nr:amidohydrolase [Treponema sp.]